MSDEDVVKKIWERAMGVGRNNNLGLESYDFASWCVMKHLEGKLDPRTNLSLRFVDYMRKTYPDNPQSWRVSNIEPKTSRRKPRQEARDQDWCTGLYDPEERTQTQRDFKDLLVEAKLNHFEMLLIWLRIIHGFTPSDLDCMNDDRQARWFRDTMAVAMEKVAATVARRNKCAE